MMAPADVTAVADPKGGAIRLAWTNPQIPNLAGTRILRRESAWPEVPHDMTTRGIHDDPGTLPGDAREFLDTGLRDEVTYYYAVVSYDQAGATFPAFVSAMSTAPYSSHSARSPCRNSEGCTMNPPSPCTGSMTTAAT